MLRKLIDAVDVSKVNRPLPAKQIVSTNDQILAQHDASDAITHAWLWPTLGKFLRPKDILLTETGDCHHRVFLIFRNLEFWGD